MHTFRLRRQEVARGSRRRQLPNAGRAADKAFLDMLGVFAEFETNLRRASAQLEGIAQAKARGVYRGRKPSIVLGEKLAHLRRFDTL